MICKMPQCFGKYSTNKYDRAKLKGKAENDECAEKVSAISNEDFCASRNLLEDCNDFAVLADVLEIASSSNDESVLASVTDTLHCHAQTFAAIGAFNPLSKVVVERYCHLRMQRPTSRTFLLALRDLVRILHVDHRVTMSIDHDLARCDQKTAVAVCSPVSDTNEIMQSSKLDPNDEIERIFSSGTTMDEPTMTRLFQKITTRMGQHMENKGKDTDAANFSCWLYWLRTFDEKKFESLVHDWLIKLSGDGLTAHLHQAFCCLAGAGCLSLENFVNTANVGQSQVNPQTHTTMATIGVQGQYDLILESVITSGISPMPWLHAPVSKQV